jgi:hypothetical protein
MAIYLTIVMEDIPDNLLVLDEPLPRNDGVFCQTMVVEDIPDHLLILGKPTLQTDDVFT